MKIGEIKHYLRMKAVKIAAAAAIAVPTLCIVASADTGGTTPSGVDTSGLDTFVTNIQSFGTKVVAALGLVALAALAVIAIKWGSKQLIGFFKSLSGRS